MIIVPIDIKILDRIKLMNVDYVVFDPKVDMVRRIRLWGKIKCI